MFNQYLKLLRIQWEQKISDDLSDSLREDLKLSLQNQSIIESEFISLIKSKIQNQWEYENFFNKKRESPFFSTYLLINAVIQDYYLQTQNILGEQSTRNYIFFPSSQYIFIESILDCLDNLLYEYDKLSEINEIVKQILFEVCYEVGGNVTIFVKKMMQNNDQELQKYQYIKAFINLQKLIKLIIPSNFKKKQKISQLIYQIIFANTLYFTYLKDIDIQKFIDINDLFQYCFLQNSMQLQELCDIEQSQDIIFFQVYYQCLKQNYRLMQYIQIIEQNSQKWIKQIKEMDDINYYLIFIYLLQITEFVDNIKFDTEQIQIRSQSIITLIQQQNHKVVGNMFRQFLSNPKLQSHLYIFDLIVENSKKETKLSYYILIGEQLLQLNDNTKILNKYIDIHIKELIEFVNDNNLNTQQLIQFIIYLCRYYQQFNEEQKIEFNSSIIQYYTQEIKDQYYYKIYDHKFLGLIENESIYQQIIDIAISNSSKSLQHSYGFLNFISQSIERNSGSFQHILRYISILMRSCKTNKKGEYKININYKKGNGTKILNYLLSNLTNFTSIVQTIYYFIIKASNKNVGQLKIYTEIYHKITYIIYMIFWLIDEREMMNLDSIQQNCLELCYIHYKFTINLIIILQNADILKSNTIYQIINNINVIAYGYDYFIQIKNMYFDKNENLLYTSDLLSKLNQRQVLLKLVFNKFYETSLSILFEVPNIQIDRKFYLQMLKLQLETQISLVLSFLDFYPKFIFYFRLARDPQVISLMQQCIVIVISLNQDPQIIKQLFETLSQHQSTILMNDLDDLQLDAYDQDEIKKAYEMANLSPHRIPLLQQNNDLLIQLVIDKDYYIKVFKIIIEIFQLVYQKWQQISSQLKEQSNLLYYQGGASSLQINFFPNPISILEGKMRIKIINQENESSNFQALDQMNLGSFLDNFEYAEKLTIFTLQFATNQEIQIAICKMKKFIIIYKEDEFYQEQDYLTNLDLTSWFNIDFQLKNNQHLIFQVNEQSFIFYVQQQENQQLQFSKFIFGVKMNDHLQESNEDFNYSIELLDQYSFEGQISEFYLIINNSKIQFEQNKKSNSKQQKMKFINSEVLKKNQLKFDDLFSISPLMQNECTIFCQNVYMLDMKKGIDFIKKCGGFNIFNMILDLLCTVCENTNAKDSEEIIILVLKIFQENILIQDSKANIFFNSQNLQNMEENCKKWININQMVSKEFIIQLLSIYMKIQNEQASILFLITLIKILDNKFTTFDQIKLIGTRREIQKLITQNCLRKFMNIHLYYESRYLFAQVSMEMSQAFINIEEIHLSSYSLSKYKFIQYQGVVVIPEINPIINFFNLLVRQKCFNLFTLDILQIIDILIEERMKQKNTIRFEEEIILNNFKKKIFLILKKQQKQIRTNQSFSYEFEVIDKLYELTFSIYFSIVQQLRFNSQENGELNSLQIYFDYFLKNKIEVGQFVISKILTLITQFEMDVLLIKQLLRFLNQLILNLLIQDSIKSTIIIWYLDFFKNAALRKQNSDVLILNLVKLQSFPLLMKHLMTTSLDNKQNCLDLFTYLIIYLIEVYPNFTSEILHQVHIQSQILNNDSFNSYLKVVYHTTISFYALKQVQQFQGKEDESKLVNIIILYLHIEQCIGEISNLEIVDWNNYSQIMDKGIDLFNYLGILFYDHDYFIPDLEDIFKVEQIIQDYHKLKKQNNRILPNGGIKRLMQQLIVPFVKIPQMMKPIRNYLSINKYSIEGRIDQESCQRIKQFIDQEFSVYLFKTEKQYRQQLVTILLDANPNLRRARTKEKSSKLVKHSKFYQLLVYYILFENSSLNEKQIVMEKQQDELQELLGQQKLYKLTDWKNVDPNLIQCFFDQHKASQGQIMNAFNQLNILKMKNKSNQNYLQGIYDLSQIGLINNELANTIRLSIFMDIIIYYQLIHKLWGLYPIIMDPQEKQRTQSNLLVHPKSSILTLFEDSRKEYHRTHIQDQEQGQQLQFQVEDQLQLIQQKLNNFIFNKKFNFKVLETRQWKRVLYLQDFTRKQPFLQIIKINQSYCSYDEKSNQVDKQQMQSKQIRSLIKKEQVIQNTVNNAIINFRKGSPENNQVGITKYHCEYITYQGAYQGVLKFNEINQSIQFQQQELESQELFSSPQVIQTTEDMFLQISLNEIVNVYPRRFLLMEIAIEIFIDRQNYFFNLFKNQEQQLLLQDFRKKKVQVIDPKQEFKKMNYQENWVEGYLSNFHYLMLVNIFSGRTYNDLSQYFVFPWVIQNYKSNQIDFYSKQESDTLRNLKLPIGAIAKNPEQIIKDFKERDITSTNGNYQHKHHYSNTQTVLKYLIRLNPQKLIEEISKTDRLFLSMENLWENSIKYDNKELIPEFYYMAEFLRNINLLPFEILQQQSRIPDVVLPNWVKTQTAEEFVYIMRLALESDAVSNELNHWIDLIFGNKNNGQNAVDNANMFHYLTYQENLNILVNQTDDYSAIQSYLTKIQDIGQTPKQLFKKNHQQREYSLQVFTNEIPNFGDNRLKRNKLYVFQQMDEKNELSKPQILGFYPYSKKCVYILKVNNEKYNHLTLLETKNLYDYFDFYYELKFKQKVELPELKIDGCNPQNMFSFIYEQEFYFGDGYDSQCYSVFEGKQNYNLYLCLVGFLDDSIKIYDLRNKMKKLKINFPSSDVKRQKRASCVRYHAVSKNLVIGSLDGLLQLFQIQFTQQLQVKGVFTKQLENGILCIDLTDLLILTVDYKNIANLLSLEGNVLHKIYLDNSDKFWQCCIQMQFLVFKSVNSSISIFTLNGEQYLKTMKLLVRTSSKNIMFTTPFSSKFLLYSLNQQGEENLPKLDPVIYYFDIFDLKQNQQQLGMLNYNRILVNKGNLRGSGISALHISFMRCKIDKQKKIKHIYLIAVDNQILQYMDEHQDYLKMVRYTLKEGGI